MRIGVDFDNTIVCYDTVFHETALKHGLIPHDCGVSKTEVRDFLRADGREDDWTVLQGVVYSDGMGLARPFTGAIEFLLNPPGGHEAIVVSHRTRRPYRGDADLHTAAKSWLAQHGLGGFLAKGQVHFEETREAKFSKIAALGCDLFIDDLPEFLTDAAFPKDVDRILFDPANLHADSEFYFRCTDWMAVTERVRAG